MEYTFGMASPAAERNEEHLLKVLRHAVRTSGISAREVERRMGMSGGYLSRLLRGHIEVKVSQVFRILEEIGLYPSEFFALAFPPGGAEPSPLMRQMMEITPQLRESFNRRPAATSPELEEKLVEAIRKAFAEEGDEGGGAAR